MSLRQTIQLTNLFASERVEAFRARYRFVNIFSSLSGFTLFLLYHGEVIQHEHKNFVYAAQALCLILLLGEPAGIYMASRNLRRGFSFTGVDSVAAALGGGVLLILALLSPWVLGVMSVQQASDSLVLGIQGGVVFFSLLRFLRGFHVLSRLANNPLQIFMASFVGLILLGAGLLMLPGATVAEGSPPFIDALFMSTSATCVTGLATMDLGTQFKPFGQVVILALIQFGGLGIMSFAAFFSVMFGSGGGIRDSAALGEMMSVNFAGRVGRTGAWIVGSTLIFETLGTVLLYGHWKGPEGYLPADQQLYHSVFHSVSAFCNAGFGLHGDSLVRYAGDWPLVLSVGSLIVLGGIGFPVIVDICTYRFWATPFIRRMPLLRKRVAKQAMPRLNLQTKIAVLTSAFLIALGTVAFWAMEYDHSLKGMSLSTQAAASLFHSISPRTAGFNTVDLVQCQPATNFFTILLMLIGGSPGSTAGGIKTTTFVVLLLAVVAMLRARSPEIFKRRIAEDVTLKSLVMLVLALAFISTATFALLLSEADSVLATSSHGSLDLLFEAVSAFCTVGLSIGTTPKLTPVGKLIIIGCMFVGRIGPLTLVLAIGRRTTQRFAYPTESVMIG